MRLNGLRSRYSVSARTHGKPKVTLRQPMFGSKTKDAVYFDAFLRSRREERRRGGDGRPDARPDGRARGRRRAAARTGEEGEGSGDVQGDTIDARDHPPTPRELITPLDRNRHPRARRAGSIASSTSSRLSPIVSCSSRWCAAPPAWPNRSPVLLLVETCQKLQTALGFLPRQKEKAQEMLALVDDVFRLETAADKVYRGGAREALRAGERAADGDEVARDLRRPRDGGRSLPERRPDQAIQGVVLEYA